MPIYPQKSREARSQIGQSDSPAAASSTPHPQDSLAEDIAICAAPQPVVGDRGATTGQPLLSDRDIVALGIVTALLVAAILSFLQSKGVIQ
jgi:hypothetical protein